MLYSIFCRILRPPRTTHFPYTTLFRSMNFAAIDELKDKHSDLDLIFVESGGDNLAATFSPERSEEHTSELQSRGHLVCRLLREKKNKAGGYATRNACDEEGGGQLEQGR